MNDLLTPLRTTREVELTGTLVPWLQEDRTPVVLRFHDGGELYVPCFSEVESLRALAGELGLTEYEIKQVQSGEGFLNELPRKIDGILLHVALDPYKQSDGRWCFCQVHRGN